MNNNFLYEVSTTELIDELINRMQNGVIYCSVPHDNNLLKNYKVCYGSVEKLREIRNNLVKAIDDINDCEAGKKDFEII